MRRLALVVALATLAQKRDAAPAPLARRALSANATADATAASPAARKRSSAR